VQQQLEDLMHHPGESVRSFADTLEPLEEQLEHLLDDLNATLRPKIERPVRERPLLAIAIAAFPRQRISRVRFFSVQSRSPGGRLWRI
jgi:hypothetical protein